MNKIILMLNLAFSASIIMAQESPVKWSFNLKHKADGSAEFTANADIKSGWNIYSVYMSPDGPVPTTFSFEEISKGTLEGKIIELSDKIKAFDELFEMEVIKFKNKALFSQIIKSEDKNLGLKGFVRYMCCDSKRCLPPTNVPFTLKL